MHLEVDCDERKLEQTTKREQTSDIEDQMASSWPVFSDSDSLTESGQKSDRENQPVVTDSASLSESISEGMTLKAEENHHRLSNSSRRLDIPSDLTEFTPAGGSDGPEEVEVLRVPSWVGDPEEDLLVAFTPRALEDLEGVKVESMAWLKDRAELSAALRQALALGFPV